MNDDFLKVIHSNFDNLRKILEQENNPKNYILIIDYLINFLGCLTLSSLKSKITDISKGKNISNLTAGEWARLIESSVTGSYNDRNLRSLKFIADEFFSISDKAILKDYIRKWIDLRNIISHDIILASNQLLEKIIKRKLFYPIKSIEQFTESLIKTTERYSKLLHSDFFHYQDGACYIYFGIEQDSKIKYKHFNKEPILLIKKDFSLPYKEVFISLSSTPLNCLFHHDKIGVNLKTMRQRIYENDFQLWVNSRLVKEIFCSYSDGDEITFPFEGFNFEDGGDNLIEVRAIRNGRIQASDEKLIRIYSQVPDIELRWEGRNIQEIPINKLYDAKIAALSVFDISDLSIDFVEGKQNLVDLNPNIIVNDTKSYSVTLNILSTHIGDETIKIKVSYTNKLGEKRIRYQNLKVAFYPNFFEPAFEGSSRDHIIQKMLSERRNYLIIGEGGIGKSRLISEFFNKTKSKYDEMTITPVQQLTEQLVKILKIKLTKKDKAEDKRYKVIKWFQDNCQTSKMTLWIKDCHEIINDENRKLLKEIADLCCNSTSSIRLILESRDETWGENARRLIDEIKETNVDLIALYRFDNDQLERVINSIFDPNNFSQHIKRVLAERSDGIIYIFLEHFKYLYNHGFIILDNEKTWSIQETPDMLQALKNMNFKNVLKFGIEECLKILDVNGLGEKARDLLRYLSFRGIHIAVLNTLLGIDSRTLQFILEILESNYVIRKVGDIYEFHHQLKRDYCAEKYLSPDLCDDYFIELSMRDKTVREQNQAGEEILDANAFFTISHGLIWHDRFLSLKEPHLSEKIEFLVYDYAGIEDDIIKIVSAYVDIFPENKVIEYLDRARILCDPVDWGDIDNFITLKNTIMQIVKKRQIDELNPSYLNLLGDLEYDELIYRLYFKYNLEDKIVSDHSLFMVLVHITKNNNLLENLALLNEIYDKLDLIRTYWELSGWEDDYRLLYFNTVMIHINGLLALVVHDDKEKYLSQYIDYVNRLFSMSVLDSEDYAASSWFLHLMSIGHKELNFLMNLIKEPSILNRINKFILQIRQHIEKNKND